ncbi:HAMP domain-containing histidine kinase [Hassallia byssoidea VB512170]|uniref:Circadian input-output histidine kinase CikA n=1 Tax=Hassallia byssoidea VB512170 TaxID=1304833 RepID=A0A846H5S8_9CYAN|nr:HAMP domain-containing sensor histidine kinase [Hassalia byssoidea]NEU72977.1 HAMP domain-containing histidine kinase [Hassalia byssoidea VB512170]
MDLSEFLLEKTDTIIVNWVEAVRQDNNIESANDLSRKGIENHIGHVLSALATVLSESQNSEIQPIVDASLHHGSLRAEQGFSAAEIAREYRILRQVIFSILEPQLLQASTSEVMRTVRLINIVLDEAIGRCFQSYTEQRLSELEQLQNHLTLNNQELSRLVRANQDNLSHLAHELKTPLTSIIGYSDLFLRLQRQKTKDNVNNLEHIERVLRSGRKLLHLINDALELSRYEAGQMKLHPASIHVDKLINDVYEMLEPLARNKNLPIEVDCDRAPDEVVTDSLRLQQIVTNLVSNAIRYTETGKIKITCQMWENDKWAIAISDTGVGIHFEDQTQIFESYFRVALSDKSYLPESTGLGLAIVSRLVKLLQGEIKLDSQVGVGSTFTVILPLSVKV